MTEIQNLYVYIDKTLPSKICINRCQTSDDTRKLKNRSNDYFENFKNKKPFRLNNKMRHAGHRTLQTNKIQRTTRTLQNSKLQRTTKRSWIINEILEYEQDVAYSVLSG